MTPIESALGQPLYRPFMILSIFLLAIITAGVWFLWQHRDPQEEISTIEKFRELVRSILTAALTAGFVILTFEGKIDPGIFANTYGIIIAFLFGQKVGERKNGGPAA